jgi:hypothetical protein
MTSSRRAKPYAGSVALRQWCGGRRAGGLLAGAVLLLSGMSAAAQDGTEHYKGKGPGANNAYLARFEEDFSYLRDPGASSDFFDPLKFIPFNDAKDVYLTLNGEFRLRTDYTQHKNFGVATGGTRSLVAGGNPTLTPATRSNENELYKQRYALGADLHLGPYFRLYADLYHVEQTGREVGPTVAANQRNALEPSNAFAEAYATVGKTLFGLRVGRQVIWLGSGLTLSPNVATSLPDPIFDGARAYADWGSGRVDAFAFNRVQRIAGVLDDADNAHSNLWGLYTSFDLPPMPLAGKTARITLEPFYLGYRTRANASGPGTGTYDDSLLLTGVTVVAATGAGFRQGEDRRHTVGLRSVGTVGGFDYDWAAMIQTGSFAGLTVDAFAFNSDTGYRFNDLPWRPRIGTHVDGASGGADGAGGTIHTYQPIRANTTYYLPNSFFSPTNFYDVAPRIKVQPTKEISAEFYYAFLWRYSEADAIYSGTAWQGGGGTNLYAATALTRGRRIGRLPDLSVVWTPLPHVSVLVELATFFPGSALRSVGAQTTSYAQWAVTLKF